MIWPSLAALFAVTTLVLTGVLLWPAGEAETETSLTGTAASTAQLACRTLGEVDPTGHADASTDAAWADMNRLSAAVSLGFTAEAQDPSYEELRTVLETPRHAQARTFAMDGPEYLDAVEQARQACEDVLSDEE